MERISVLLLGLLGLESFDFDLKIVNDYLISGVNQEFLGCVGPTNVLSFPHFESPDLSDSNYLGEIVLSVDTLSREVRLYGQKSEEHTVRLLAHALLHLAGYGHGPEMFSLTENAVDSIASAFRGEIVV